MDSVIVWHRWSAPLDPTQDAVALAAWWRRSARERFAEVGAELLFELGGSAAFALAGEQLGSALVLCARLAREAARDEQAGGIACGIALGPLWRAEGESTYVGDAIERAQVLAHAAAPHEVLIDAAARAHSAAEFLFARDLTLADGLRASALDPACPRKSDCLRAVIELHRPAPPESAGATRALLMRLASTPGRQRVLLVAPHGHGVGALLEELAEQVSPSAWLALRAPGSALAPLSGLASALATVAPRAAPEQVLVGPDDREREARAQLIAIREGDAVPRREAIVALRRYLLRLSERGRRPLITVDAAPLIDPSSVGVIAEAVRDGSSAPLVIMRMLLDAKPPASFGRDGGFTELRLPALERHEAQALAAGLLGAQPGDDIARRAAVLGGDNPRAVLEAVRNMVASGDVVRDDGTYRWRRGPVAASAARPLEALLEERIDGLAAPLRQALEILGALPDVADDALGAAIAAREGMLRDDWQHALRTLVALGFAQQLGAHVGVGPAVRQVLRALTAPGRAVALHRAVADELGAEQARRGPARFARATLAYYLAHAGRTDEAAALFLEVATLAGQLGYLRSGVRLAASAVECDDSAETRTRAAQLAQRLSAAHPGGQDGASTRVSQTGLPPITVEAPLGGDRPPATTPQTLAGQARARAIDALRARDYDEVERALDLLTAAGQAPASIERIRALTLLAKGDPEGARDLLGRQRGDGATPRLTLTEALAALASGELEQAVRSGLEALARTREAGDARGERASLSVLSLCYRDLGRDADAARFAQAALAPLPPA